MSIKSEVLQKHKNIFVLSAIDGNTADHRDIVLEWAKQYCLSNANATSCMHNGDILLYCTDHVAFVQRWFGQHVHAKLVKRARNADL
jgi:hypothetical protein